MSITVHESHLCAFLDISRGRRGRVRLSGCGGEWWGDQRWKSRVMLLTIARNKKL